jgi:hypothetical protein
MHRKISRTLSSGILAVVLGGAPVVALAGGAAQSPPASASGDKAAPTQPDEGPSGSSTGSLSHQLNRSGGVIHPRADIDPGLTQPAPTSVRTACR